MEIKDAEDLGFLQAWEGKQAPNEAYDWPSDLLAAWHRGREQFIAWE